MPSPATCQVAWVACRFPGHILALPCNHVSPPSLVPQSGHSHSPAGETSSLRVMLLLGPHVQLAGRGPHNKTNIKRAARLLEAAAGAGHQQCLQQRLV